MIHGEATEPGSFTARAFPPHSFVMGACLIIAQLWGSRVGSWSSIGDTILVLEALSVLFTPRGLIGKLMGLQLVDSRTLEPAPRRA